MKYKNIIFDYGNTIAVFEPKEIIKSFGITDEYKVSLLNEKAFDRKYWDKLDSGELSQEDFIKNVKSDLPSELHSDAKKICNGWITKLPYIEGMETVFIDDNESNINAAKLLNINAYLFDGQTDKAEAFIYGL